MTDARAIFQATLDFLVAHMRPDEDVHSVVLRTLGSDDVVAITGDVQWYLLHKDVDSAQSLHDLLDERTPSSLIPKKFVGLFGRRACFLYRIEAVDGRVRQILRRDLDNIDVNDIVDKYLQSSALLCNELA